MAYGVTDTGFVIKPVSVIEQEMRDAYRQRIGASLNTEAESPFGQHIGINASLAGELWETAEATYNAGSILTASGQALDRKLALSGIARNGATQSSVTATVNLDAGVTLPAGRQAHVDGDTSAVFETLVPVTNSGGAPADVSVQMVATSTGPVRANAGTLTEILTPYAGWNSVTNAQDADLGSLAEKDPAARSRYARAASGRGLRTLDAIRNAVEAVADVSEAFVFENPLDVTGTGKVAGLPPHSIEVVVNDGGLGDADDIAQAIWDRKGDGIETHGSVSGTATDGNGDAQTVNFNRVSEIDIYIEVTVAVNGDFSASSGATGLKTAIADWGDSNLVVGGDVILSQLACPIFDFGGVVDLVLLRVSDDGATWQTTNYEVLSRQLAVFDTSRITVIVQ